MDSTAGWSIPNDYFKFVRQIKSVNLKIKSFHNQMISISLQLMAIHESKLQSKVATSDVSTQKKEKKEKEQRQSVR